MKAVIVVPTIRRESAICFLNAWAEEFANHTIIVVEDGPEVSFDTGLPNLIHYSWADIDRDLGKDAWIIPRRTDCVRSFGYFKALGLGADVIVTLDDDCFPADGGFVKAHYEKLTYPVETEAWESTIIGMMPRGMPYDNRSVSRLCMVNHGLWTGIPDYDAMTQLVSSRSRRDYEVREQIIPRGKYFPMCGMNLAFRPAMITAMYFLLMGRDWGFDRFGDIWCGIIVKKICDHLGFAVSSGRPVIEHRRASNVWANREKEVTGYRANESFWRCVDSLILTETTVDGCYREIADRLPLRDDYWLRVRKAMLVWRELCTGSGGEEYVHATAGARAEGLLFEKPSATAS